MQVQRKRLINNRLKLIIWKILIPDFKWDLILCIDIAYIRINQSYLLIFVVIPKHSPCGRNIFYLWIIYYIKNLTIILKVWNSHKTQLYCSQTGLRFFIELLVRQHISAPSFRPSSGLQDVHTCSSQLLFL